MTSKFDHMELDSKNLVAYGQARARDVAYDAVMRLWDRRKSEGLTQKELAMILGIDESRVSKMFRGPGNWTFKTVGALVAAMNGEMEIEIYPLEEPLLTKENYHAYDDFANTSLGVSISPSEFADTAENRHIVRKTTTASTAGEVNLVASTRDDGLNNRLEAHSTDALVLEERHA